MFDVPPLGKALAIVHVVPGFYTTDVGGSPVVLLSSSLPSKQRDVISIQFNEAAYKERLTLCQHSFIARVFVGKGETPWKLVNLEAKLFQIWILQTWKLISISMGCYQVFLYTAADKSRIWSMGSLSLKSDILSIQA